MKVDHGATCKRDQGVYILQACIEPGIEKLNLNYPTFLHLSLIPLFVSPHPQILVESFCIRDLILYRTWDITYRMTFCSR